MSYVRRIAALPVIGAALTLAAFGVVRGASDAGPARGTRFVVGIAQPVDAAKRVMAARTVRERLDEKGMQVRVIEAGERLIVETSEDDAEIARATVPVLERTAQLEVRTFELTFTWAGAPPPPAEIVFAGGVPLSKDRAALTAYVSSLGTPEGRVLRYGNTQFEHDTWRPFMLHLEILLTGREIRDARVDGGGIVLTLAEPAQMPVGQTVAFVLADKVVGLGIPGTRIGQSQHVATPGRTIDEQIRAAVDLLPALTAGAAPPLRVEQYEPFTRATGFWPRAWPFLAIAGVFLVVAVVLLWPRTAPV